jgi:DNA mismatch repair protein MutL
LLNSKEIILFLNTVLLAAGFLGHTKIINKTYKVLFQSNNLGKMAIKLLDDALITKIAAGEVIERPASVIKELVENSIDAGATQIVIELKNAGKKLITIKDNGCGMSHEDAKLACVRHATSKISKLKDLFEIQTMGFRGEALASVSAVSDLTIITKTKDTTTGYFVHYHFGPLVEERIFASNTGTTITIKDLFLKLPARLKYLKEETVELRYIMSIMTKISLINYNIAFTVKNDDEILLSTNGDSFTNTVSSVLGTQISRDMIFVNEQNVTGYISKPNLTRSDKSNQFIYVNNRPIENKTISDAIHDAYHTLLFLERNPILVLNILVNPNEVDVNVHPTKKEVRFEHADLIYRTMFNAIKKTLEKNNLTTVVHADNQTSLSVPKNDGVISVKEDDSRYSGFIQKELNTTLNNVNIISDKNNNYENNNDNYEKNSEKYIIPNIDVPSDDFFVLGQAHKTFIICETKEGIIMYDQHATEERINYEKYMSQANDIKKQMLLEPKTIELNPKEMKIVLERINEIKQMGFDVELFGTNTIIVREIPAIFLKQQDVKIIYDIINTFESAKNKTFEDIKHNIAATMACRASIKAGDVLSRSEMVELIREYKKCKLPYTCPHGRPAHLFLSVTELEKLFKRIA